MTTVVEIIKREVSTVETTAPGPQGPPGTGGGGAVSSVAGRTGDVVLVAADVSDSTATGQAVLTAADAAAARSVIGTDAAGDARPPTAHSHDIADVSGLSAALSAKLDVTHEGAGGSVHALATASVAGFMSAADKTKLDGIAAGATANATDAALRDRATHTGTQTAATISDFAAAARAQIEAALIEGTNITITPAGSGATRTFTIDAAGGGGGTSTRHDWAPPYSYIGTAPTGSAESSAVWSISRIEVAADGSTTTLTATGVTWTGRAGHTYS